MRLVRTSFATPIRVLVVVCAPLLSAVAAQGETVNIRDLMVFYASQSASGAQGTIEFNLRFASFDGSVASYDAFSSQVMINRILRGAPAIFTLREGLSEAISADPQYWLHSNGNPIAEPQDDEFLFEDRISLSLPLVEPSPGDVLAHYVIGFDVGPSGFGTYRVGMGSATSNFFSRSIFTPTFNTLAPDPDEDTFMLVAPEPTSGLLVLLGGTMLLRRRRRR